MPHKRKTINNVRAAHSYELNAAQRQVLSKRLGIDANSTKAERVLKEVEDVATIYKHAVAQKITAKQVHTWLESTHTRAQRLRDDLTDIHPTVKEFLSDAGFQGITAITNTKRLLDELDRYLTASNRCRDLAKTLSEIKKREGSDPFRECLIHSVSDIFCKYADGNHLGQDALKSFVRAVMDIFEVPYPAPEESRSKFNKLFSKDSLHDVPRKSKITPPKDGC